MILRVFQCHQALLFLIIVQWNFIIISSSENDVMKLGSSLGGNSNSSTWEKRPHDQNDMEWPWGSGTSAPIPSPPPVPLPNNTCFSHKTCSECALYSHLCHFCEFDQQCHAIGSWYGCADGEFLLVSSCRLSLCKYLRHYHHFPISIDYRYQLLL